MNWNCATCGTQFEDLPLCFGTEAPWRALVPESEFSRRVDLTADQCVVDGEVFFVRGHIEIPIHGHSESLAFSVWSSLSEKSFLHMSERWEATDRAGDSPYFGWLCTPIPAYPDTIHLKLSVQSRAPGVVPLLTVEPSDHPLSLEQQHGISVSRWQELVHDLMHSG